MSAANLTETPNVLLVLPFTAGLLRDPSALLRLLFHTAERATSTVSVVFTTPGSGAQLYSALRAAPRKHFDALQNFLAEVYAALAAGHWAAGRVLVDVEVHFDGELGDWTQKLLATPDRVVLLECKWKRE
jgi:pantetheine-phosphate adenylyltransferase